MNIDSGRRRGRLSALTAALAIGALAIGAIALAACSSGSQPATGTVGNTGDTGASQAATSAPTSLNSAATTAGDSAGAEAAGSEASGDVSDSGSAGGKATGSEATGATAESGASSPTDDQTADATAADADTTAAIEHAYATFISPDATTAETLASLENGDQFADVIAQQGQGSMAGIAADASATVSDITLVSADVAKLTYTISVSDKPLLPDQPGYAVKQDGQWKISDYTFCGLLKLEMGDAVPDICSSPQATQAPS